MNGKLAQGRATILDVARIAGVGVGTVSRVINHARHVRPTTAAKVRRVMDELGYVPSEPAQRPGPRLGRRRAGAPLQDVTLLILGSGGLRWILDCAPVYAYVLEGIESALSQHGKKLIVRQAEDWRSVTPSLQQSATDGLIVLAQSDPPDLMPATLRQKPAVWVMGSPRQFSGDHVRGDHLAVGALAAHHALAHGHRCCAYLGTEVNTLSYQVGLRGSAFQWQVTEAGGSVLMLVQRDLNIVTAGLNAPNEPLLGQLLDQMLAARPRPTLLMLQADMFAPSVYRHLAERGIRPQRDLAIITCNNERPYLVSLQPAPTVVDLQAQAIGRRAVEQLLWRRDHPDEPPCQVLVQPRLLTSDPTPQ